MKILEGGRTFSSGLHAEISVPVVTKKGLKMAGDSDKHAIMIWALLAGSAPTTYNDNPALACSRFQETAY